MAGNWYPAKTVSVYFKFMIMFVEQDLWANDDYPMFGATMSHNRFQFLLSHLRIDNAALHHEAVKHDKFAAAR